MGSTGRLLHGRDTSLAGELCQRNRGRLERAQVTPDHLRATRPEELRHGPKRQAGGPAR